MIVIEENLESLAIEMTHERLDEMRARVSPQIRRKKGHAQAAGRIGEVGKRLIHWRTDRPTVGEVLLVQLLA